MSIFESKAKEDLRRQNLALVDNLLFLFTFFYGHHCDTLIIITSIKRQIYLNILINYVAHSFIFKMIYDEQSESNIPHRFSQLLVTAEARNFSHFKYWYVQICAPNCTTTGEITLIP